ncbi:MAG TPA: hypothetical protein VIV11_09390 [Kofleriaceae bacterium]
MVVKPVENRAETPPLVELDLVTLESGVSVPYAADRTALWPTTRRGAVLYAIAAVVAIIVGVIPALWINRWRAEATTESAAAPAEQPPLEPAGLAAEPEETATAPAPSMPTVPAIAPAKAPATGRTPTVTTRPPRKTTKPPRRKPERVKQPPREKDKEKECDVYLHPKGCPR